MLFVSTEIQAFGITAFANEDYILPNSTLDFIGDRPIQTFTIIIIGDSEAEFVEQVGIRLANGDERLLTITDDDGLLLVFKKMSMKKSRRQISATIFFLSDRRVMFTYSF